jgi:hypothetical protein
MWLSPTVTSLPMSESSPRKICLTVLLEINEERASRGLPPLSSKDWAESLERSIDSMTPPTPQPGATGSCSAGADPALPMYEQLKAMLRRSS